MIARVAGERIAPPMPWSARAATSVPGDGRDRAEQRGAGEEQGAGEEHAPAAEEVGRAPAEQQEAGEGERVGVQDPLQAVGGEAQRVLDRRQRDVHDRDVEDRP